MICKISTKMNLTFFVLIFLCFLMSIKLEISLKSSGSPLKSWWFAQIILCSDLHYSALVSEGRCGVSMI